jgi:hypothetical protein
MDLTKPTFAGLIFAVTAFAPLLRAQSAGSISGLITNSITGAGVEDVKVRAACLKGGSTHCPDADARALTDIAGAFRLPALPDGRYLMSVEKNGFSWSYTGLPVATVSASGDARFDSKMTPLASLHGRVVDPEGKPVAGIMVQFGPGDPTTTDAQGTFVVQKRAPGSYQLWAKVKPQADGKDGERMVTTYYPSAIYAEQAVKIEVQGVDLSGYEIRLRTAPARTVRGVLLDADGKPRPHASVELSKAAAAPGLIPMIRGAFSLGRLLATSSTAIWDHSDTGTDGAFEFAAVLEGDWILKGYDLGSRQGGATEVHVGRSDVDNITVRLAEPFPIEVTPDLGASSDLGGSPQRAPASAWVLPLDGQVVGGMGRDAGPPFTQHALGPPGRYLFGPGEATRGYYVSAAMLNGRDVLGQAVELSGPTTVKLVYKKDGGTLRGAVEKGGGSTVVLMADPTPEARFGLTARCDPDGNFSIPDVPPGNYTAVAFQDNWVLYQPDLLSRIDSAHGERVKIEAGASETVTLKVN